MYDQRSLIQTQNLLRPKAITNNQLFLGGGQADEVTFKSEIGKNAGYMRPAGDVHQNVGGEYTTRPGRVPADGYCPAWIENPQYNTFGEVSGADDNLVEITKQDWIVPDTEDVTMFGEKAANAADHFLESARPENGLSTKRGAHLDGPVLKNVATAEADAGQMSDCYDASSGFGCDGNNFTSLTQNSME
jgi:hypothetical protein